MRTIRLLRQFTVFSDVHGNLPGLEAILADLEDRFVLQTQAGELLAVHGSPRRINEYLCDDRPEHAMDRMAAENPYRAILFVHTHMPYTRWVPRDDHGASTLFVNVGSAGRPKDGGWRVCYALVDPGRLEPDQDAVEFVRVPYAYDHLATALAATDLVTSFQAPAAGTGA